MRDRITTKDALVFIMLLQQDAAGIYGMMWEAMSGAFLLDWIRGSNHNASAGAPVDEARGQRVPAVYDSAMNAPRAAAGEFSGQSGLLDAA
jgi:hypothetical protein